MKRSVWTAGLAVLGALWAGAAWAQVHITSVSVSPQILLEAFRSAQNNLNTVTWVNPNVVMLAVSSEGATDGQNLNFNIEISDNGTPVASINHFQVSRPLAAGSNMFNAGDINANGLQITFNQKYAPSLDAGHFSQGNPMPMGNYRVVIRPVAPTPGDPYVLNISLFTPASALNLAPVAIYPKDVEVNTYLPTFSWTPVSKAAWYEVAVGPETSLDVNTYWKSGKITGTQVLYAPSARVLENGKKYFWQVQAFDGTGSPVGGVDGKSQPASFTVVSSAQLSTLVSPLEAEAVLRTTVPDPGIFSKLTAYQPVALETDATDAADLLRQLKDGSAKVISAHLE